ncbi:MAG: thioredoxin domain-containing protein, partial [Deltaproteobacteria bacterium]|nr:thioredoxin domain-containing protein [Deltaproteobacteria bacterium]
MRWVLPMLSLALGSCARAEDVTPGPLVPGYRVADAEAQDGEWTNRLVTETSPYLLQHAHNPVDWYPWGDEAFEEAKRREVPVFLSVGYAACHWCHVMEEESFEDPAVAAYLNANFVCIKVDREERPDVDALYMDAVYMFNGSGGWPASLWLTPERVPFYAGTYFPKEGRLGRPGFVDILELVHERWTEDPAEVARIAADVADGLQRRSIVPPTDDLPTDAPRRGIVQLDRSWDAEYAGWGSGRKFPMVSNLEFLLAYGVTHADDHALGRVRDALDAMDRGGIHDHLGGGFHRYTVDGEWVVPHFEKMTYDNGQLLRVYAEASAVL